MMPNTIITGIISVVLLVIWAEWLLSLAQSKKNVFILSVVMSLLLMTAMALAADPLNFPADGGRVSGSPFWVNGTTGNTSIQACQLTVTDVSGLTNLTSATTALASNFTNTSVADHFNFSINSLALEDHNKYNFSVVCNTSIAGGARLFNWSDEVLVDNTVPTDPTTLTTTKQISKSFSLTSTVNDAQTTSCAVDFQTGFPGSAKPTCSYSTTTATVSITNAGDGSYCYTMTASDGSNTSSKSSEACFVVDAKGDSGIGTLTPEQIQEQLTGKKAVASRGQQVADALKGLLVKLGNILRGLFN